LLVVDPSELGPECRQTLEQVLGYLNFSSGAADPQFLAGLNRLFGTIETADGNAAGDAPGDNGAAWQIAGELLRGRLAKLQAESAAFRDADQAAAVIDLVWDHVLPGYVEFHRDLLFHHTGATLFRPMMVGRAVESVLQQGPPWDQTARITQDALRQLNDYIGHRPVAVLETQKIEPYAHERCRPVPLYIEDAGVDPGRHHDVVQQALAILDETDEDILRDAFFDPQQLHELAFDPRAYDFDHPVHKRPVYLFGQWDPHCIDNKGFYRRFVIQQVTLDALMQRIEEDDDAPREEYVLEAAAVLAGTVLMASGISGNGPDTHDSNTSLVLLMPHVAGFRDRFYERWVARVKGPHGKRLRAEAERFRQPLGAARQHLNAQLARRRAAQVEHVQLAQTFARMGYPEGAARQVDVVPTASARMRCRMACDLVAAHQAIDARNLRDATDLADRIVDLLRRAIECGAIVDPWNFLGFDANFSLFPALENSIHDHRTDDLLAVMDDIFSLMSRIWSEAAAVHDARTCERVSGRFRELAQWWRQFAVHEVSSADTADALDTYQMAEHLAEALGLWRRGGAAAGDVRFWAEHSEMFLSPKAYATVVEALLDRGDLVASMALLIGWLEQADEIGLEQGATSYHTLAGRWMDRLGRSGDDGKPSSPGKTAAEDSPDADRQWTLACQFLDRIEANAEEYWNVPGLELARGRQEDDASPAADAAGIAEDEDDEEENPYDAAYENVVYRDSTDDGMDASIFDPDQTSDDALEGEWKRIVERLVFLGTLAGLWKLASANCVRCGTVSPEQAEVMHRWYAQAAVNRRRLAELVDAVHRYPIRPPTNDRESMVQFDRQRTVKELLLEEIITTCVDTADAGRFILAAMASGGNGAAAQAALKDTAGAKEDEQKAVVLCGAVFRGAAKTVRAVWTDFVKTINREPIVYVPLGKGGDPQQIVDARIRQGVLRDLLEWLPRLGLLAETCQLLEIARLMERAHPVGADAVTQFDELFEVGYRSLVNSLVTVAERPAPSAEADTPGRLSDDELVGYLERISQSLMQTWLAHSRTLRLTVLEKVKQKKPWQRLVAFIKKYGGDLFTQHFLNLGNLRAILHEGVEAWIAQLEDDPYAEQPLFIEHLDDELPRREAEAHLSLIVHAVVENYTEYIDYNSTTTQSDDGSLLYMLFDFLRLQVSYDRMAWVLRPVVHAHEILLRRGRGHAAELWRRALMERTTDEADDFTRKLAQLQKKYAMRMPTVADRIGERFVRPMAVDRICALVEPALREAAEEGESTAFSLLQQEAEALADDPTGVGFDLPEWLQTLDEEVDRVRHRDDVDVMEAIVPQERLSLAEVEDQLNHWNE